MTPDTVRFPTRTGPAAPTTAAPAYRALLERHGDEVTVGFTGRAGPAAADAFRHTSTSRPRSHRITKFGLRSGTAASRSDGALRSDAASEAVSSRRARGAPMQ